MTQQSARSSSEVIIERSQQAIVRTREAFRRSCDNLENCSKAILRSRAALELSQVTIKRAGETVAYAREVAAHTMEIMKAQCLLVIGRHYGATDDRRNG